MRLLNTFTPTLPLALTLTLSAAPAHLALMQEADAAARAGDDVAVLAKLEEVAVLRPDYPRAHLNLAMYRAQAGEPDAAMTALRRLAEMGVRVNVVSNAAFDSLRELPAFQELAPRLQSGPDPVGADQAASLTLTGVTGIIESCLRDPATGGWFLGDVHNGCIWKSGADGGTMEKFTSDEEALDGVFRLALSSDGKTLWASSSTVGVMTGANVGAGKRAAIVAIDFATGRVRDRYPAPDDGRKHLIGDFIIASDGAIFATDSMSPVIWRLAPGGTAIEPWIEHDDFVNLQGLTMSADGTTLYVADYTNGIWRINVATRIHSRLMPPANASFFGIDALALVGDALVAVQSGVNPQRVLRIEPVAEGPSKARIVACGLPAMTDLALGSVTGGRFHFVANSGWSLFDPAPGTPPAPREVTVVSVPVD